MRGAHWLNIGYVIFDILSRRNSSGNPEKQGINGSNADDLRRAQFGSSKRASAESNGYAPPIATNLTCKPFPNARAIRSRVSMVTF